MLLPPDMKKKNAVRKSMDASEGRGGGGGSGGGGPRAAPGGKAGAASEGVGITLGRGDRGEGGLCSDMVSSSPLDTATRTRDKQEMTINKLQLTKIVTH